MGTLALISLPFIRKLSYELFLRVHQSLTVASIYGAWRHLPKAELLPSLYLMVGMGVFAATSVSNIAALFYRNGAFSGNGFPRAVLSRSTDCLNEGTKDVPYKVRLLLPRPVKVGTGQYINLWLPAVSFWSWTQTHPFTVVSWSQREQSVLELLIHPRKGLTGTIGRQLQTIAMGSWGYSSVALYSGPHGLSEPVGHYERVLLIANDSGLSAVLPYARELIHGHNTCSSRVRRVHLVWQVGKRGKSMLLNLNNLKK